MSLALIGLGPSSCGLALKRPGPGPGPGAVISPSLSKPIHEVVLCNATGQYVSKGHLQEILSKIPPLLPAYWTNMERTHL
ncbi:hypothetical protein AMTR_s00147p00012190 [Amborella trichopoda]|uniref:Uncharacterized protein n=1 Tax=Amborella trichopoda TaxID=13333 RepID=W1P9Q0_AMBTC|nr:hypothetical protein AMTR_s00147p00012190 [Amborella trichopoda]